MVETGGALLEISRRRGGEEETGRETPEKGREARERYGRERTERERERDLQERGCCAVALRRLCRVGSTNNNKIIQLRIKLLNDTVSIKFEGGCYNRDLIIWIFFFLKTVGINNFLKMV